MKKNLFLLVAVLTIAACGANKKDASATFGLNEVFEQADVAVFYFHSKVRCPSCLAIQDVTQKAVAEKFADNDQVKYFELDVSDSANKEFADKYEVYSSSLIVATKNDQVYLTHDGFTHARSNPQALKDIIEEEVNNLLQTIK
jgi:thiol-disulfide isomerase/thioredoxin